MRVSKMYFGISGVFYRGIEEIEKIEKIEKIEEIDGWIDVIGDVAWFSCGDIRSLCGNGGSPCGRNILS